MKYDIITNLPSGKKVAGIYKIENLINHKVYIGQSLDVYRRFMAHINAKDITKFHNSLRKYGYKNFSFELIKETYDLNYWEHFLVKLYKATDDRYGYNMVEGGMSDNWGYVNDLVRKGIIKPYKMTEEQIKKRQQARFGLKVSPEGRKSLSMKLRKYTKEHPEVVYKRVKWMYEMSKDEKEGYRLKQRLASHKRKDILCLETGEKFLSERDVCSKLNISRTKLRKIIKLKESYKGFHYEKIN